MSWRDVQQRMIEELNTKVFMDDPCRKIQEEYSSMDIENNNYIQELKNRRVSPTRYDGSLIEKKKYDFLVTQGKILNKIPGYVCKFDDDSYWAWNLKKLPEPIWYEKSYRVLQLYLILHSQPRNANRWPRGDYGWARTVQRGLWKRVPLEAQQCTKY